MRPVIPYHSMPLVVNSVNPNMLNFPFSHIYNVPIVLNDILCRFSVLWFGLSVLKFGLKVNINSALR